MPTSLVSTGVQFPDSTIQTTAATAGGSITATASGSISNGGAVAVNSDGTVSAVTVTPVPLSTGAAAQIGTFYANQPYTCQCAVNATTVVAFTRNASNGYFYGYVGTVSGTTITWGTAQLITTNNVYYASCAYNATLDRIVVLGYEADSGQYTWWLFSRSGNTLSTLASITPLGSSGTGYYMTGSTFDSGNNFYGVWSNNNYYLVMTKVAVTASTLTLTSSNTAANFEFFSNTPLIYDPISNTCVVAYRDSSNYGSARSINSVLSVSARVVFNSGTTAHISPIYVPTIQRIAFVFRNDAVAGYAFSAVTGTVSANTPSFDSVVNLSTSVGAIAYTNTVWDTAVGAIFVTYTASTNANVFGGTITFSGNTPTYLVAPANMISDATQASEQYGLAYLSGVGKSVCLYNVFSVGYFSARVATAPGNLYNVSSFVGFSSASYTNGQTATVNVVGGSNSSQTSLTPGTKYYVQNNGTLSSSATTQPYAGIALSSTRILVKG